MRHRPLRLPGPEGWRHHRALRGAGDPTYVGATRFDLHLPHGHSLKEKRAVLRPIIEGVRHRFRVAVAEVAYHDQWQRAGLGVAVVASTEAHVTDVLDEVDRFVWSFPEIEVLSAERSWLEAD